MFRVMTLIETGHETDHVWSDLFHSLITVTTAGLPLLIIPPTLVVATVRACVHGHCCQVRQIITGIGKPRRGNSKCELFIPS